VRHSCDVCDVCDVLDDACLTMLTRRERMQACGVYCVPVLRHVAAATAHLLAMLPH
jgi:hypothetical protein